MSSVSPPFTAAEADLSNKAFPWLSARQIEIGYARMLAMRVNYVGELGWELHIPMDQALQVWDALWDAGREFGLIGAGQRERHHAEPLSAEVIL